jgi:hypothetical protein
MSENSNPIEEIEKEIEETRRKAKSENFEIEVTDEKEVEAQAETQSEEVEEAPQSKEEKDKQYSEAVQARLNKMSAQRRQAELQAKKYQEETATLKARLERLENSNSQQQSQRIQSDFDRRYALTKEALKKAVEEGDTDAQVSFSEQLADMRAAVRVNEMQNQLRQQQQTQSPTVGRAQQAAVNPAPPKAMGWWQQNQWFNAQGYERETAAARAIDVQLDLEGYDKNSDDYYSQLNSRLQKVFPELVSSNDQSTKSKSRKIVTPTTGGSSYRGNRVRMTQDQLRMARELGINDEAGLKKYASEIQKSQRS